MMERTVSRRRLLAMAGSTALAAGASSTAFLPKHARAQPKTLKILQWKHFVPAYDQWFNETFTKQWGERNDTQVIVDNVGFGELTSQAAAEIQSQRGHDLVQFVTPHGMYHDHVIDHREIYEECGRRYGKPADFAVRTNYNPATKIYLGFSAAYQPALVTYRRDLWNAVQARTDKWSDVLTGARRVRLLHDKPVGISLAPEHNCEQTLRAIMYSFGASEQDAAGNPALNSKAMLETINYVKSLYEQTMTKDSLAWDGASNNRFMLTGEGCFTVDSLSIVRASENMKLPAETDLALAQMPEGSAGRFGSFGFYNYAIWKFAENVDGAKRFLADYVGSSREAFLASGFQNMPCYKDAVPDLAALTVAEGDRIPGKYSIMQKVPTWTTNVGHPGYTNPAVSEVYAKGLIPKMFAKAATGQLAPEAALGETSREVQLIFEKWKESGKL